MTEERTITENIKGFCRINNIRNQLYKIREQLRDIDEGDLAVYSEDFFIDKLCSKNSSQGYIQALFKLIDETERTGFGQDDIDTLKDVIEGRIITELIPAEQE